MGNLSRPTLATIRPTKKILKAAVILLVSVMFKPRAARGRHPIQLITSLKLSLGTRIKSISPSLIIVLRICFLMGRPFLEIPSNTVAFRQANQTFIADVFNKREVSVTTTSIGI